MMAHAAEFFTLDEVNRLKIIQDVVDRRLSIYDRQCRRLLSRYREHGPLAMANSEHAQHNPRTLCRLRADAGV